MDLLERTKEILSDLIAFPTVSSESNLDLVDYVADLLRDVGASVDVQKSECGAKANLFATLGPAVDGGVVLSGHTDVVPVTDQDWSTDPFQMNERDGKLFGRGTCDMKAFIAITLARVPQLVRQKLSTPVHFAPILARLKVSCPK